MEKLEKGSWSIDIRSNELQWDSITKSIHEVPENFIPVLNEAINFYRDDYREKVRQDVSQLFETGIGWDTISCLVTANHNQIWVRSIGFAIEYENNKVVKIAGSFYNCSDELFDLTQKNNLSHYLDSIAGITHSNLAGNITQVNPMMLKLSGYTQLELLGQSHQVFNSGHHSKDFFKDLWSTILEGEQWHGEILNKAKDGSLIWFDTHIVPVLDHDRNIIEFLSIRFDITEKKMKEEKDRQMYSLLTIGENAVSILHEVMNPLSIISAKLELLKREVSRIENNDNLNRHLIGIEGNLKRISQIFQDMRGMLNGEGHFSEFQMKEVLEKVKGFTSMKLLKNNTQLIVIGDINIQYYGNEGYVTQILLNLINNAIDANTQNSQKWIEVSVIDMGDSEVLISVMDSGNGISENVRSKIFEPLYSTKKKAGGTGLGLSLSKQLANQ